MSTDPLLNAADKVVELLVRSNWVERLKSDVLPPDAWQALYRLSAEVTYAKEHKPAAWEIVPTALGDVTVRRLEVPGGWLYRVTSAYGSTQPPTTTFVPRTHA